ncbi:hypothetical protein R4I97_07400 [Brachyspira pilosicoli]|uniref:hypothetical protein n=1 Tax=Brachyspira pilosicoli TaxID=52584 RepID=UPI0030063E9F
MNKILDDYINSFDNILNFYYDLIDIKEDSEILKNINDDDKKKLFDYLFDKYLDEENILIALSVGNYYENEIIKLNDIKIFFTIKDYCKDIIENKINNLRESEIRNIYLLLDMSIFIDEDYEKINNMYFDKYLTYIEKSISSIDNKNYFYYIKLISFIIIIKLYTNKLDNNSINIIMPLIKKLGTEYRQYNMLGNLLLYLEDEYIKLDIVYDNFIKYYFEISSRILNKKDMHPLILNNNIKIILSIIDVISDFKEKLKNVLDIFFINDSKELKELFNNIRYGIKIYNLDIPIYCLSKNKNLVNCLSDEQYPVFMIYLIANFKNNEIKIKIYDDIEIDLSCYIDILQKYFLSFCKGNNEMPDIYLTDNYRDLLLSLNITADDFNNFTKIMQNYFAWNIIKETDELYQYIPENIKKEKSIDKEYREKIEKEKSLYEEKRFSCVHSFFFKDKLISDIDDIIKCLGEIPTYKDLALYNQEYNKYKNKNEYLDKEIVIINPFIIYYSLIISKIFLKTIDMNEIKKYIETYWDKHWGIHLYNYMQYISDIRDKVIFTDEEKIKIKKYFEVDFEDNIKDLHNCLIGVNDNSYLYYLFYNFDNIFKDIDINYHENILLNLLKIPYYYYRGNIKLYNNYYYLEYMGIIEERFDEIIDFNKFFSKSSCTKNGLLFLLFENIDNVNIIYNTEIYATILCSIIKIYISMEEDTDIFNNIEKKLSKLYLLKICFNKIEDRYIKYSTIGNFIKEHDLFNDIKKLDTINLFPPVKVIIENNTYCVYDLKTDSKLIEINDITTLVDYLIVDNGCNISRILYFKYLIKDIKEKRLTISHPYNFEDNNENMYSLDEKVYMCCFSNTVDSENSYANWKIYGTSYSDDVDNIKVRILVNKKDLIKNILKIKDDNYIYYFGNILYDKLKDPKNVNQHIYDFFIKNDAFKFENEFRVLIECVNKDDSNILRNDNDIPNFLRLPICNILYKNITLNNESSFNPYRNILDKDKEAIKFLLKEQQDKI